jgi:HPt (histidine-containing phosphotransfer) domain-containing protein
MLRLRNVTTREAIAMVPDGFHDGGNRDIGEVFDLAAALEGVDGRYDRLQKMVEFYFGEAAVLLAQMQAGLEAQDAVAITRAAHRLAGTLVYLKAEPALAAARRVDDLSVAGDLQCVAEAIPRLEHQLALLDRALVPHRAETKRPV